MNEDWKNPVRVPLFTDALIQEIIDAAKNGGYIHLEADIHVGHLATANDTPTRFSSAGHCARQIAYEALGLENTLDPASQSVAFNGSVYHALLQPAIQRRYPGAQVEVVGNLSPLCDNSGRADAVIAGWEETDGPEATASIYVQDRADEDGLLVVDGSDDAEWVRRHGDWWAWGGKCSDAPARLRALVWADSRGIPRRPSVQGEGVCEPATPGGGNPTGEQSATGPLALAQDPLSAGASVQAREDSAVLPGVPCDQPTSEACRVKAHNRLFELKTKSSYQFDVAAGIARKAYNWAKEGPKGPGLDVILQAALNALAHDCDTVAIGYVTFENLGVPLARKLELRQFERFLNEWHIPREVWEPMARVEIERLNEILQSVEMGYLPERETYEDETTLKVLNPDLARADFRCDYCSFRERCSEDGPGTVAIPVQIRRTA